MNSKSKKKQNENATLDEAEFRKHLKTLMEVPPKPRKKKGKGKSINKKNK